MRVLLVEDDPIQQRLVKAQLDLESIAAHPLGSLAEACEAIPSVKFDAILLDLGLPDSDGLSTLLAVRALTSVPIVVLSGDASPDTERLILQAGADDFLVKGEAAPRQTARALRLALDRAQLQADLDEARRREQQDRELLHLDRLAYGVVPLRISHPIEFRTQAQLYGHLIELAVRGNEDMVGKMKSIAEELHSLEARPRDCIELHKEVLMRASPSHAASVDYAEHARICLLDLVCALCSLYRSTSMERGLQLRAQSADLEALREEVRLLTVKVSELQDQLFELGRRQSGRGTGPLGSPPLALEAEIVDVDAELVEPNVAWEAPHDASEPDE